MKNVKDQNIEIPVDSIYLSAILNIPNNAKGIVLFAHGSGSSRLSPRNNYVARSLQRANIATLLLDLLTPTEDLEYESRFDIDLLAKRLESAAGWAMAQPVSSGLKLGFFGASTGSAAAIKASVGLENKVSALVSRGGRVDLAASELLEYKVPTLLVIGGNDREVLELNEKVYDKIDSAKKLEVVLGASHLFEEEGTLEEVSRLATEWFENYFTV